MTARYKITGSRVDPKEYPFVRWSYSVRDTKTNHIFQTHSWLQALSLTEDFINIDEGKPDDKSPNHQ